MSASTLHDVRTAFRERVRAWPVSDLLLPVPPVRVRRALLLIALAASAVVVSRILQDVVAADAHFALFWGKGVVVSFYAVVGGALLGALGCRQQLMASPSMLLVPVTSNALVAAGAALWMVANGAAASAAHWLIALITLQLVSLPLAARLWGMLFIRMGVAPKAAHSLRPSTHRPAIEITTLLAYFAAPLLLATPLAELLAHAAQLVEGVLA